MMEPLEIALLSIKLRGAAGPMILWAIGVLTMTSAVKMVW
jgi:hypothetical protein